MARERCAFCGALNPANAQWCGQCLRQFPPEEMTEAGSELADQGTLDSSRAEEVAASSQAGSSASAPDKAATRGAFTVTEAGITWTCARCENVNPLEAQICSVCGTSFADIVRPQPDRPQREPNTVALISLFMPGAGHMYLGQWAQGIARAIVSLWVTSVVVVALVAGKNSGALAGTFGVAATALWVIAANDSYREARSEPDRVILKGRMFLYVVLALLMVLFFLLLSAGLAARS